MPRTTDPLRPGGVSEASARPRALAGVFVTAALTFALAASAFAAKPKQVHPKNGKSYSGVTSEHPINGFHAPVSFTVSKFGTKLLHFQYATFGCFTGSFQGNPFIQRFAVQRLGSVKVKSDGSFSVKGVTVVIFDPVAAERITTTTDVTGKFKTAKSATGKISFTQSVRRVGGRFGCSKHYTFTATTK